MYEQPTDRGYPAARGVESHATSAAGLGWPHNTGLGCAAPGSILPRGVTATESSEPVIASRLNTLHSRASELLEEVCVLRQRLTSVSRPPEQSANKQEQPVIPPNDVPVASSITQVILTLLETKETVTRILEHLEVP